jgi:N-acetylglucosamine kinase-like BadF-type ATPase
MAEVLGIDVGGTKTHFAQATDGVIQREFFVRTSTWRTPSAERNAVALEKLVREDFGTLELPVAIGAHGCDSTQQCLDLEESLKRRFGGPVLVVNDAELMPPAMGIPGGVGMVAGTGSIAVARDPGRNLVTAGGWGWVLGDEGSASGLIREATKAVLGALDRGAGSDPLTAPLLAAFEARDGAELAMAVTRSNSADRWGAHAGLIFTAADAGSALAMQVISEAGAALAELVDRLVARGVGVRTVVAGGAVIQNQARLREALRAALKPEVELVVLDRPPIYGALALAGLTEPPTPHALTPEATHD